ncbi:SpoIIE family protein phosphatase [Streptosporangium sandarakinum]|uniref:SpoIIE family protein phosphatase n=1 Tax=Streptosporangium sandarakinum TaxID=1260955 RepID=UPI0033B5552A
MRAGAEAEARLSGLAEAGAEVVSVSAGQALDLLGADGPPGGRRPTLVVLGAELPAPVGLVHALRPDPRDLAVVVLTTFRNQERAAALPLLAPARLVCALPHDRLGDLPGLARRLMEQVDRERAYAATQAAMQESLASGGPAPRQPGRHLLGAILGQALTGALLLDPGLRLVAWNRRAAGLFGLEEPGSIGRPLDGWFPAEARERLRAYLGGPPADASGTGPAGTHASGIDASGTGPAGTHAPGTHASGIDASGIDASRTGPAGTDPSWADPVFTRVTGDGTEQVLRLSPQPVTDPGGAEQILVLAEDVTEAVQARWALAERTGQALLSGEVAAAVTADEPLEQRLRRCVQALAGHLDGAVAAVWILDPPTDTLLLTADAVRGAVLDDRCARVPLGESTIGRIAAAGRPYVTSEAIGDPHVEEQDWVRRESLTAFAGYPLVIQGQVMGVLAVLARHRLPDTGVRALAGIADQIAVAVHRDRLLERLSATADALQRPLLPPRLPEPPGVELAARYRPYGDGLQIGGDFYDAFPLPGDRWAVALGDVCGKGPAAAAVTGLVRHTLWAAAQQDADPGHVLPLVHRALRRENSPFCTLAYAVVDCSAEPVRVRLACAGHPSPILRRAGGAVAMVMEALDGYGPALGLFDGAHYPAQSLDLHPGDSLVLYTDGFVEGGASHRQRQPDDLAVTLAAHLPPGPGDRQADRIVEVLMADALNRWGDGLRDDLAVLALAAVPRVGGGQAARARTASSAVS